jgi:putative transposase
MKRKRFTEEQIAFALRQAESGTTVDEICRKMGVSEPMFYRWKKQFVGMGVAEICHLKQLEEENGKLKKIVAYLTWSVNLYDSVGRQAGVKSPAPGLGEHSEEILRAAGCTSAEILARFLLAQHLRTIEQFVGRAARSRASTVSGMAATFTRMSPRQARDGFYNPSTAPARHRHIAIYKGVRSRRSRDP